MELVPPELRTVFGSWTGPGSNITVYPVRRGQLMNLVAGFAGDWQSESWTERGTHADCAAAFAGWHPTALDFIRNVPVPYKWGMFLHPPMERWSQGRITLLGDACHPTLPSLGQGANMAIEDGWILARCLADWADPETALQKYETARASRAAAIVDQSWQQVKRRDAPALAQPENAEAYVRTLWDDANIKDWYDWIYAYDADAQAL
jgi:salicylate hydroxylase